MYNDRLDFVVVMGNSDAKMILYIPREIRVKELRRRIAVPIDLRNMASLEFWARLFFVRGWAFVAMMRSKKVSAKPKSC